MSHPTMERVVALELGEEVRAYPFSSLSDVAVMNDKVAGGGTSSSCGRPAPRVRSTMGPSLRGGTWGAAAYSITCAAESIPSR